MKIRLMGTVLALALVSSFAPEMQSSVHAAAQEKVWGSLKGTVKEISEKLLVVAPSMDSKASSTFELTSDIKRAGTLEVGGSVTVRYFYEGGKRVVTELSGKAAKK
jgi:hypothetical protein